MTRRMLSAFVRSAVILGAIATVAACSQTGPVGPEPATPTPPPGQFMLTGIVVNDDGVGIADVELEATSGAGITTTVSASDGSFSLPAVGEVTLRAHVPGYRRAELTIQMTGDTAVGVYLTRQRGDEAR